METRNDENQILSQFHVAMLSFHNNLVDALGIRNFTRAMNTVIKYYQWVILHDFLPLFCGQAVIDQLLAGKGKVYDPGARVAAPIMPVEFSTAAYRFGHSIIRNAYSINPVISPNNKNARNTLFAGVGGATGDPGGGGRSADPGRGPAWRLPPDARPPDRLAQLPRGPVRPVGARRVPPGPQAARRRGRPA